MTKICHDLHLGGLASCESAQASFTRKVSWALCKEGDEKGTACFLEGREAGSPPRRDHWLSASPWLTVCKPWRDAPEIKSGKSCILCSGFVITQHFAG